MPIFRGKNFVSANSDYKDSVRSATRSNVNLDANVLTVDGVSLASSNRVLLAGQTDQRQNGIYYWNASTQRLARAFDADSIWELSAGNKIYVEEGTTHARSTWVLVTQGVITPGTTNLVFAKENKVSLTDLSGTYGGSNKTVQIVLTETGQIETITEYNITGGGGVGSDAETLGGQAGSYYLNYANFTGSPNLSITTAAASGSGSLSYSSGTFTFAPADLSSFVTSSSLSSTLGSYVTSSSLSSTLGSYATQAYVTGQGYTTNTGTVTSVAGTGTVSGLTLTGTVTSTGNLTLGGTLTLTSGDVTTALGYTPPTALTQLSDVNITGTITTGYALKWDGTKWTPGEIAASGGSAGTTYTGTTTDDTLTTIATIPANQNKAVLVVADIIARRTDAGATDVAAWRIRSVARRETGNAIDVGQVYEEVIVRTNSSLFVDIESSSTNINVKVQGIAGQNYSWKAVVQLTEV